MKILWYLFCFFSLPIQSLPYDSISDLYDTDYQYEEMDNDISEEIRVTKTPEFISKALKIVSFELEIRISFGQLQTKNVN